MLASEHFRCGFAARTGPFSHRICPCCQSLYSIFLPRGSQKKNNCCDEHRVVVAEIATSEIIILLGGSSGHVDNSSAGYDEVPGWHAWAHTNEEDERMLALPCPANWSLVTSVPISDPFTWLPLRQVEWVLSSTTCSLEKLSASMWVMSRFCLSRRSPDNNTCWSVISVPASPPTLKKSHIPCIGSWCLGKQQAKLEYQ